MTSDTQPPSGSKQRSSGSRTAEFTKTMPDVDRVIRDLAGTATRPTDADLAGHILVEHVEVIFERRDGWRLGAPLQFERTAFETWSDRWVAYWVRGQARWVRLPISNHRYLAGDCQIAAEEQIRNLIGRWGQQGAAGYRRALLLAGVIDELLGKNLLGTALDSSPEGCSYKAARRFVRETLGPQPSERSFLIRFDLVDRVLAACRGALGRLWEHEDPEASAEHQALGDANRELMLVAMAAIGHLPDSTGDEVPDA